MYDKKSFHFISSDEQLRTWFNSVFYTLMCIKTICIRNQLEYSGL